MDKVREKCLADLCYTNVKANGWVLGDEYIAFLQEMTSSKVTIYRGFENTATSVHYTES